RRGPPTGGSIPRSRRRWASDPAPSGCRWASRASRTSSRTWIRRSAPVRRHSARAHAGLADGSRDLRAATSGRGRPTGFPSTLRGEPPARGALIPATGPALPASGQSRREPVLALHAGDCRRGAGSGPRAHPVNSGRGPLVRTDGSGRIEHDAMASRLFLVLLLLSLPVATVALLPDPLWIPGLYDGADYDDCLAVCDSPSAGVTPPVHTDLA